MKSRLFSSIVLATVTLATTLAVIACGSDDPINSPNNDSCLEAKCESVPISSSAMVPVVTSSEASVPASSASVEDPATDCVATPVEYPLNDFVDVGEIYKNTQCNEKVVFILRHGKREGYTGSLSALQEDGFESAQEAGAKMAGPEKFKYIFSGMVRTYQTAAGIAMGRGEVSCTSDYLEAEDGIDHFAVDCPTFQADTLTQLKDGWFLKDKEIRDAYVARDSINNVNTMYTAWVYDGKYEDAFYDLDERSKEFLALLVKDYKDMPKFTVVASHDQVLMPLTAWATQKQIDLKLHDPTSRKWLNFLAGVAIIINDKNKVRYVAAKGMDSGVQ